MGNKQYNIGFDDLKLESKGPINDIYSIILGNEKWFFKRENKKTNKLTMSATDFEVFASFLLKRVFTEKYNKCVVNYEYAELKGYVLQGCASKSFLSKKENYIDYLPIFMMDLYNNLTKQNLRYAEYENCKVLTNIYFNQWCDAKKDIELREKKFVLSVQTIVQSIEKYAKEMKLKCNVKQLEFDLTKMVISDYFISNSDRNITNITFIITKNKHLELAPIFDNGLSNGILFESAEKRFYDKKQQGDLPRFKPMITLSTDGETVDFENNKLYGNKGVLPLEIYELSKKSPKVKEIVDNFINLNLEKCFDDFAKEKGKVLPDNIKERISIYYNKKREEYLKKVNRLNKKINKEIGIER